MNVHSGIPGTLRLILLTTVLCLYTGDSADPEENSKRTTYDVVQFDAIVELNAPILKSHVVLFARYWVTPTFYRIAVLWAEPHAFNLNFPMYPVTMAVDSNERSFVITNQVQSQLGRTFRKPVGERGIFRHKLNSYPIGDVRFTETEALASRIYRNDLGMLTPWVTDGLATVDLGDRKIEGGVKRDATALNLRVSNNRVDAVDILDANNLLVKRIEYEYSQRQGRDMLCGQEVLLPERPLLLGYGERGVTIRVNDKERMFKELYGVDHEGGRRCSVKYEPVEAGGTALTLLASIVVRRADTGMVLRTARMSNFVHLTLTAEAVGEAAKQVGQLSREELAVRGLFAKYGQGDPNRITADDAIRVQQLREHFANAPVDGAVGGRLRQLNALMQLDWLQGRQLSDHFREYLVLLGTNGLHQAAFIGGLNTIDTAVRRRPCSVADDLLHKWTEHMINTSDAQTLLPLARAQMRKGHSWAIAEILEEAANSGDAWTPWRFQTQALRCVSLYDIFKTTREPSKKATAIATAQAAWASESLGPRTLDSVLGESSSNAKRLFAELAKPDAEQKTLRRELDVIDQHLRKAACLQSLEEPRPGQEGGAENETEEPKRVE